MSNSFLPPSESPTDALRTDRSETLHKFVGDVRIYSVSSVATLVTGFAQALLLPAVLSLEEFGLWRMFFLYVGYAGFLNFGFTDGVLLRWAGSLPDDRRAELSKALRYLLGQQLLLAVLMVAFANVVPVSVEYWLVGFIVAGIVIVNLLTVARFYLQASLRFRRLSLAQAVVSFSFIVGIGLLVVAGMITARLVMALYILTIMSGFLLMIGAESSRFSYRQKLDWKEIIAFGASNTRSGFFILMGNLNLILLATIDKLVVNWSESIATFAVYSFAGVVVALVYQLLSTVSEVLFPHLMRLERDQQERLYTLGKHMVIVAAGLIMGAFFPFRWAVLRLYPDYAASVPVTRILLLGTCFGATIGLIQANYFKIRYQQRTFFLLGVVVNFLFLTTALIISGSNQPAHYALISLVASFSWYAVNDLHLHRAMRMSLNSMWWGLLAVVGFALWFWSASALDIDNWWGMLLYLSGALALAVIVLWPERRRLAPLWTEIFTKTKWCIS
jgi:O-antigen/teichoic acid export membrane protein